MGKIIFLLLVILSLNCYGQNKMEALISGGSTFFSNTTTYERNFSMSVGFNLPINNHFTIQPMYTSGSIKGKFVNGYFANEISISQLNLVYNLYLTEIMKPLITIVNCYCLINEFIN